MGPVSTGARQITKFQAIWLIEADKIQLFFSIISRLLRSMERDEEISPLFPPLLRMTRRQEGNLLPPELVCVEAQLSWCFDFGATQVDHGLSNTALLDQLVLLKVVKPLLFQEPGHLLSGARGCREPKPTFTPSLPKAESIHPQCRKKEMPNLLICIDPTPPSL